MEFAHKFRTLLFAVAAIGSTAALHYFGNGLNPIWPLVWLAPVPILLFALHNSLWRAALATFAAELLGILNLWSYFTHTLQAPPIAWISIAVSSALLFTLGVLLLRALVLSGHHGLGLISLPALWTSCEYLRSLFSVHGTAGCLGYSQISFPAFLQLASVTGIWGLSFVLLLAPSSLAIALFLVTKAPQQAARVAVTGAAIIALVLGFGVLRLAQTTHSDQTVLVGLIASDAGTNDRVAAPGKPTVDLLQAYAHEARQLAAQGARVIVIPEKLGVVLRNNASVTDTILQSAADETGSTIVAGLIARDSATKWNEARIYQPHQSVARYDKQHMLPPFESDLKPGTELVTLNSDRQNWGIAICKDMDFIHPAREYGKAGVGMMLVPAWDFVVDGGWHGHNAILRGVENGYSVARAAKEGLLTISDAEGRIVAEQPTISTDFATLLVRVPTNHQPTLYLLLGDWFAWLAIALTACSLLALLRSKRS